MMVLIFACRAISAMYRRKRADCDFFLAAGNMQDDFARAHRRHRLPHLPPASSNDTATHATLSAALSFTPGAPSGRAKVHRAMTLATATAAIGPLAVRHG
jgi:hypothetical protein